VTDSFQWERCAGDAGGSSCTDIAGATGSTYTLVADDVGHTIRARGTRDGVLIGESDHTAVVAAAGAGPTEPRQGISLPLPNISGKSSGDQDFILDQIVALGNGHDMWVRTDWFPSSSSFAAVAAKIATRPSLHVLPILNYDPGSRPSVSAYASQAAEVAQLYPYVNLLNEPNLGGWSAADAAAYTKAAYAAIGGDAIVVGPSAGFNLGAGHGPSNVLAWHQAYHDAGGRQDIGAVTCYGDADHVDAGWNGWSVVPQIKSLLGGRLIILEGGFHVSTGTVTPYQRSTMSWEAYQAICVQTGMAARASGRVESFITYSLLNDASPGGFGLLDNARAQRPAYGALVAGAA
jgi:hypothetical protein